jgi:hypothetical protein
MSFQKIFNRLLTNKKRKLNTPFEQAFFLDRLSHFDNQIHLFWKQSEAFDFLKTESNPQATAIKPKPIKIKSDNPKLINQKLKHWAKLRKKANISSDELTDGIKLLIDYGVWTDEIIVLLDEYIKNETIVYSTDTQSIIISLLEYSIRSINWEIEEDFESDEIFDFEKYFENNLRLPFNIAGFYNLKFSQSSKPWQWENLINYTFVFELNHLKNTITITSDCDLFLLIRTVLNGILLKHESNFRIYRIENCPYPIFLEKELALHLMKRHGILFFHDSWL